MNTPGLNFDLSAEISTDPINLSLPAMALVGNDIGIANALNSLTGPGAANITIPSIDKGTWLEYTTPAAIRLSLGVGSDNSTVLTPTIINKWQAVLDQGKATDPGAKIPLAILSTIGNPVNDLVMTQAEMNAISTRIGSRAEVLGGAGTIVTPYQCSQSR